jgi:hypothetical protein
LGRGFHRCSALIIDARQREMVSWGEAVVSG